MVLGVFNISVFDSVVIFVWIVFGGMVVILKCVIMVEVVFMGVEWSEEGIVLVFVVFGEDFILMSDMCVLVSYCFEIVCNMLWCYLFEDKGIVVFVLEVML